MKTLVLASSNQGKIRELNDLLGNIGFDVQPQSNFNVPDAIEDGLSFVENAIIKARNACKYSGHPSLADDSGIEVDALNGAPGIYSARYAGLNATDDQNNAALINALQNIPEGKRTARYQCVLVYMRHEKDPTPIICHGSWEGEILSIAKGAGGFGYDPYFWVINHNCTAAELTKDLKNAISHRGKALKLLVEHLMTATAAI